MPSNANLSRDPYFFNTLESAKTLMDSGFTEKQAEAQTKIIGNLLSLVSKSQVTKQDIHLLEERLKRELEEKYHGLGVQIIQVKSSLEAKIAHVETSLEAKMAHVETSLETKMVRVEESLEAKITHVETSLEAKIAQSESRLESKLMQIESHLIKMLFTAFGATTGVLALLMAYLH